MAVGLLMMVVKPYEIEGLTIGHKIRNHVDAGLAGRAAFENTCYCLASSPQPVELWFQILVSQSRLGGRLHAPRHNLAGVVACS